MTSVHLHDNNFVHRYRDEYKKYSLNFCDSHCEQGTQSVDPATLAAACAALERTIAMLREALAAVMPGPAAGYPSMVCARSFHSPAHCVPYVLTVSISPARSVCLSYILLAFSISVSNSMFFSFSTSCPGIQRSVHTCNVRSYLYCTQCQSQEYAMRILAAKFIPRLF